MNNIQKIITGFAIATSIFATGVKTDAQRKDHALKQVKARAKTEENLLPPFNDSGVVKVFSYQGSQLVPISDSTSPFHSDSTTNWLLEPKISFGSGTMIADGVILTAAHVVKGAKFIAVQVPGDITTYPALLVPNPSSADFAFLTIHKGNGGFGVHISLPASPIKLPAGSTVFAYGYPEIVGEVEPNVTKGIISRYSNIFHQWQFDAVIQPGNSGGPLVTGNGEILGVIIQKVDEGLNLALPLDEVLQGWQSVQNSLMSPIQQKVSSLPVSSVEFATFVSKSADEEQQAERVSEETFSRLEAEMQSWNQQTDGETWALAQNVRACHYFDETSDLLRRNNLKMFEASTGKWINSADSINYFSTETQAVNTMGYSREYDSVHPGAKLYDNIAGMAINIVYLLDNYGTATAPPPATQWADAGLGKVIGTLGQDISELSAMMGQPVKVSSDQTTPGALDERFQDGDGLICLAVVDNASSSVVSIVVSAPQLQSVPYTCLGGLDPSTSISDIQTRLGNPIDTSDNSMGGRIYSWKLSSGKVIGIGTDSSNDTTDPINGTSPRYTISLSNQ